MSNSLEETRRCNGRRIMVLSIQFIYNPGINLYEKGNKMELKNDQPATIDEYIAQFPAEVQEVLGSIRAVIRETVPEAEEKISYGMPAFHLNGNLIYFAANKNHIGIYPKTEGMEKLAEMADYKGTKGSVHFPLNQPIPHEFLRKIVQVRVEETQNKAASRARKSARQKDDQASGS